MLELKLNPVSKSDIWDASAGLYYGWHRQGGFWCPLDNYSFIALISV